MKELTVIIPCLNEAQTIGRVVRDAMRALELFLWWWGSRFW